jgi:pilus assembly protein CpaC
VNDRSRIFIICLPALLFGACFGPSLGGQAPASNAAAAPQASAQDSSNDLSVFVAKSVLVDFDKRVTRIAVGLGDVAEATAVSPTEVMVNGKAPGDTTLIVWEQGGGRQFFNISVHPSRFASEDRMTELRRELKLALPSQNISVASENNLVFLRGTVKDLTSSDRAVEIASTAGKVVNLLYVQVPPAPRQILLKVRFASVDRTRSKQLALNFFSTGAANTVGTITTGQASPPTVSLPSGTSTAVATVSNALNFFFFRPDLNLGATIQALETKGDLQVLAEPNVLAQNGKEASFLAGGQYPYPIVQGVTGGGAGAVTIQFKEFGVRLSFIPTIMPDGNIRLQVSPEVSSLDFANGIQISGFNVPAINIRRVKTEVELSHGQSFVIGGLLDNRETQTLSKIPFIGDVPILGKFFQSITKTRTNSELIVIVTPEIVEPIKADQPLPKLDYPEPFLPPNSKASTHNPEDTAANAPPPDTVPVEELIKSMEPEKPLVDSAGSGAYGASSSTTSTSMPQ